MFKRAQQEDSFIEDAPVSSSSDSDEESIIASEKSQQKSTRGWKTALIGSRGIGPTCRKFINELSALLPHSKKESKYECKGRNLGGLLEICELSNCEYCVYVLDAKEKSFLWVSSVGGPSIKYEIHFAEGSDGQGFDGNCSKFSRPLLLFSPFFWKNQEGNMHRTILSKVFGSPMNHRKIRPYFDRLFYFINTDHGIIFRNFEVSNDFSVREIGPRFVLTPILIQGGPFSGPLLWKSSEIFSKPSVEAAKKAVFGATKKRRMANSLLSKDRKRSALVNEPSFEDIIYS